MHLAVLLLAYLLQQHREGERYDERDEAGMGGRGGFLDRGKVPEGEFQLDAAAQAFPSVDFHSHLPLSLPPPFLPSKVFIFFHLTVVNCSDPGFVENSVRQSGQPQRHQESFSFGSSVVFHCKAGFYLLGSSLLTCQADARWDRALPKCLGEPTPPTAAIGCISSSI